MGLKLSPCRCFMFLPAESCSHFVRLLKVLLIFVMRGTWGVIYKKMWFGGWGLFPSGKQFTAVALLYRKKIVGNTLLFILEICLWSRGYSFIHLLIFFSKTLLCAIYWFPHFCLYSLSPSLQGFYGLERRTSIKHIIK